MSSYPMGDMENEVEEVGEGLPPEAKPRGRLKSMTQEEWGNATIYDLEPEPDMGPVKPLEDKVKTSRKQFFTKSNTESAIPGGVENVSEYAHEETEFWRLNFFQSAMIATILEDTITQLRILIECNNSMRIAKAMADMEILLAIKYNIQQKVKTDELDGIDPKKLHCMEYKLDKLETDRNQALDFFIKLYVELSTDKSFSILLDCLSKEQDRIDYAAKTEEDEIKNRVLRKELAKQLRIQRNHHKTVTYDAEGLINRLKAQVEDSSLISETKGRYIDNWQAARTEQHAQNIFERESQSTNSTEYYKNRADHESRVHSEVESLTAIAINETLKSVEDWMEKYEVDMEKMDLRIQIQKSDYQNMYDRRRDLEDTIAKRDKEIKAWIKFKDDRAAAQKYANTMTKSAIIVQAWWRGLLVRKQLGPYRLKKGKAGKGKK